jgi:hypothetical protein
VLYLPFASPRPLAPAAHFAWSTSWTEELSRRNFDAVSQVVSPGDPMKSRLLLRPLAPEAGADPLHTGGKFWKSRDNPEWQVMAESVRNVLRVSPARKWPLRLPRRCQLILRFSRPAWSPSSRKKWPDHVGYYYYHS